VVSVHWRGGKARVLALECETTAVRPANVRARITNRLRESPAGVDGRSERGRRWRDLLEGLIAEYGTADPEKLREVAALRLSLEATQAAVVRGDIRRSEDLVRLANLISRRERELQVKQRQREAEPPVGLRSKLSARYKSPAP
jgi:hypothetical protein